MANRARKPKAIKRVKRKATTRKTARNHITLTIRNGLKVPNRNRLAERDGMAKTKQTRTSTYQSSRFYTNLPVYFKMYFL